VYVRRVLIRVSLFAIQTSFFCIHSGGCCVRWYSAIACLEKLVSEMTYYVSTFTRSP